MVLWLLNQPTSHSQSRSLWTPLKDSCAELIWSHSTACSGGWRVAQAPIPSFEIYSPGGNLAGLTVLLGGSRWVPYKMLSRLASWASLGIGLVWGMLLVQLQKGVVWSCRSLERPARNSFPLHWARRKGWVSQRPDPSRDLLSSGPLYLHLRCFTKVIVYSYNIDEYTQFSTF